MKTLVAALIGLFLLLQYCLWFDSNGVAKLWNLKKALAVQTKENTELKQHNDAFAAEVNDLKHGQDAIEERARSELGMIKKGETYYQVIEK